MLSRLFGYSQAQTNPPTDTEEPDSTSPYPSQSSPTNPIKSENEISSPSQSPIISANGTLMLTDPAPGAVLSQDVMYATCNAFIRPTFTSNLYELIIFRTDEPDPDETAYPDQVTFSITADSAFQSFDECLGWSDDSPKRFYFDFDDESERSEFTATLARVLYQNIHSESPGPGDIEEVQALLRPPEPVKPSDLLAAAGELIRVAGSLYKFETDQDKFRIVEPDAIITINVATVKDDSSRAFLMSVYAEKDGRRIMESELDNTMTGKFYTETTSVVWLINMDPDAEPNTDNQQIPDPDKCICLSFKIDNQKEFERFREHYSLCLYEVNHQASMDDLKLKDDDREYIADIDRDDVDPMDIDDDYDYDAEEERTIREERKSDRASIGDTQDGMRNAQLAVSANTDRTFVLRGNKMGIFRTGSDGAALATTVPFRDPADRTKSFAPSNIFLHEGDTSMLVLDANDNSRVMRMDLERGEVVDTWSGPVMKHNTVENVHKVSKYSNLTGTKEFVGLNKNCLLRMDPRTSEFIVQSKKYAASTRAKLDCMATTGNGQLAVASENGDIRLYDQIGKNAKTHLPGLGDRIIGIDVSEDGNYILATTAKYLLVINTVVKGEKTYSGFMKSMGKNKPTPRKLVIKPEDIVRHRMGEINFTTAHFNTGRSTLERSIVTSSGPFLITWNFRAVKTGRLDAYKINRYIDNIVADDFAFGDEGRIVMCMPDDVSLVRR